MAYETGKHIWLVAFRRMMMLYRGVLALVLALLALAAAGGAGVALAQGETVSGSSGGQDREALVALYNATDGANWTDNANWLTDKPLDTWHGVTTDASGRVTELDLWENGLTGPIPPELGNLTSLEELFLESNGLTGSIPPELGDLSNLKELYLGDNALTGTLPHGLLGLAALEFISFHSNPGLCAPADSAFQQWLQSIDLVLGSSCGAVDSPEDRAILVAFFNAMDGAIGRTIPTGSLICQSVSGTVSPPTQTGGSMGWYFKKTTCEGRSRRSWRT